MAIWLAIAGFSFEHFNFLLADYGTYHLSAKVCQGKIWLRHWSIPPPCEDMNPQGMWKVDVGRVDGVVFQPLLRWLAWLCQLICKFLYKKESPSVLKCVYLQNSAYWLGREWSNQLQDQELLTFVSNFSGWSGGGREWGEGTSQMQIKAKKKVKVLVAQS